MRDVNVLGSKAYLRKLRKRVMDNYDGEIMNYTILAGIKVELMIQDYYDYEDDSADIDDKTWDEYCSEFNRAIREYGEITESIHYFRNELNRAPATLDELLNNKEKWNLLPIIYSLYHMNGEEGVFNTKFISNDGEGKYEGVYNKRGVLLTEENDPINMGTYNYCSTSVDIVRHRLLDVIPYKEWGNIKGCPDAGMRNIIDYYSNKEAVEAYNKIKNVIEGEGAQGN